MNATETRWFIRDKQLPEGVNRLLCVNRTGKYLAFLTKEECEAYIDAMPPSSEGYEPIELEVE